MNARHSTEHAYTNSSHSTGSEVDRNILSLMNESSVDFVSKFAKLASHVANEDMDESRD